MDTRVYTHYHHHHHHQTRRMNVPFSIWNIFELYFIHRKVFLLVAIESSTLAVGFVWPGVWADKPANEQTVTRHGGHTNIYAHALLWFEHIWAKSENVK